MFRDESAISVVIVSLSALVLLLVVAAGLYIMLSVTPQSQVTRPQVPELQVNPAPKKGPIEIPARANLTIKAISSSEFRPSFVHISVGSTITWENVDKEGHTVTSQNVTADGKPIFHSVVFPGDKFEMKFDKSGIYYYQCLIKFHTMSGIIRVSGG